MVHSLCLGRILSFLLLQSSTHILGPDPSVLGQLYWSSCSRQNPAPSQAGNGKGQHLELQTEGEMGSQDSPSIANGRN